MDRVASPEATGAERVGAGMAGTGVGAAIGSSISAGPVWPVGAGGAESPARRHGEKEARRGPDRATAARADGRLRPETRRAEGREVEEHRVGELGVGSRGVDGHAVEAGEALRIEECGADASSVEASSFEACSGEACSGEACSGEAYAVLERLSRVRRLEREQAPVSSLLDELQELARESAAWAVLEGDQRAVSAAAALAHALDRLSGDRPTDARRADSPALQITLKESGLR